MKTLNLQNLSDKEYIYSGVYLITFPNNKNNISYKDFNLINRKGKIIHFYIDKSGKYTAEILT